MPSVCPGDIIADKYRVERLLGAGGMGYVVAARHITLDQLVAIKLLAKGALGEDGDEEAYARFRREAKAVVRLAGEHVARVFDVGVHVAPSGDEPFIVMEYLEGADLSAIAKERGALSAAEACEYLLQACEGLAEPHALGIVHRDIKLANLFLTRSPSGFSLLKVLDFGVSKTPSSSGAFDVTRTTAMIGSPKYMSPEQMNDPRSVDARTDVWSLGVVLYRLVAGKAPFEGDTIGRLCTMVLHEVPPPIRTVRPDLPAGFDLVIDRCLQKNRDLRFANVAELAAALVPYAAEPDRARERAEQIARVLGVPPPPPGAAGLALPGSTLVTTMNAWTSTGSRPIAVPSSPRSHAVLGLAAGAMAIAVAVLGYTLVVRAPASVAKAATSLPPPPVTAPPPLTAPVAAPLTAEPVETGKLPPAVSTTAPPPATTVVQPAVRKPVAPRRPATSVPSSPPVIPDDRK
jgi:serine/threonine-protein kinase